MFTWTFVPARPQPAGPSAVTVAGRYLPAPKLLWPIHLRHFADIDRSYPICLFPQVKQTFNPQVLGSSPSGGTGQGGQSPFLWPLPFPFPPRFLGGGCSTWTGVVDGGG